jgi:hypothetical protein
LAVLIAIMLSLHAGFAWPIAALGAMLLGLVVALLGSPAWHEELSRRR